MNHCYHDNSIEIINPHNKCNCCLTKLETAIKKSYDKAESAQKYASEIYKKLSSIILDPSGSYGKSKIEEMIESTGEKTLIEAICSLCNMMESGDVNLTYDSIVDALGYVPARESGETYVAGYILEDE